jgi:protoporphyrinogen oxidase
MQNQTIIIGAGVSGLSCAYHLQQAGRADYTVLEASPRYGGLCASYTKNGFTFDCSGHLLHIASKYGLKLTQKLLGKNVNLLKRKAFVHLYGKTVPFPFQNNLYFMEDDKFISSCVQDALLSYKQNKPKDAPMFKDWALALYGKSICQHFMFPYNQKLWQTDLKNLTSAWCGSFVPSSTLEDIIKGAYGKQRKDYGYNTHFFYPKTGGAQALCDALAKKTVNINLNTAVTQIDPKNKTVTANGKEISYKNLVSTMPLKTLGGIIKGLPADIKKQFSLLKHNTVYVLNIAATGKTKDGHWYYFAQDSYPFYRIGVQSAFSPANAPQGACSFYVEFAFPSDAKKPDFKKLEEQTFKHLKELGFIEQQENILFADWLEIPQAYPVYDTAYADAREKIVAYLSSQNIYLLGRYGAWEYSFMEKSLLDGAALAACLLKV